MAADFRSSVPGYLTAGLTAIGLAFAIHVSVVPADGPPGLAKISMIFWLALSVGLTLVVVPRNFVAGFLTGLAAMLIGWRVAGVHGLDVITFPLLAAFVAFIAQFLDCIRHDRQSADPRLSVADWHLTFLRMYIGFDLVPHFTEKLFASGSAFDADVAAFANFGLPIPVFFVILGGLCEFGIMVGIGLGLFTRLAGLCAALYFLIATLLGKHFTLGFIWAEPGGGWEYSALMMVLFLSFVYAGAGRFSLDGALIAAGRMPGALMPLSVRRASRPT